ncbi:MAG TPA: hypothetical protein ACQGQJ_05740 [Xylella fastidiosa subsp. multiplex]
MTITVNAETPATLKALLADLIPAIADSGAPLQTVATTQRIRRTLTTEEEEEEEEEEITRNRALAALSETASTFGKKEAKRVLARFNADNVEGVHKKDLNALIEQCKQCFIANGCEHAWVDV